MTTTWQWIKENAGYVYGVIFSVLAVLDIIQGEIVFAVLDFILAGVFVWYYQCPEGPGYDRPWKKPKDGRVARYIPSDGSIPTLLSKGLEPAPIPGENVGPVHKLGTDPDCGVCASMMGKD